jgi:protoporphyrinogen oxidase
MIECDNLIIGAGISGLSVAYYLRKLGKEYLIIEQGEPGGLCRTITHNGFFFDLTGHVIHFRDEDYKNFIENILKDNLLCLKRKAIFFFRGHYAPYPFQIYFYKIPIKEIADECIAGLRDLDRLTHKKAPNNFKEWIVANFGAGISKYFMIPYNEKLWCFPLEQISLEWVKKYIPKLDTSYLLKIIENKNSDQLEVGYNTYFFYPKEGGIGTIPKSIVAKIGDNMLTKTRLVSVNLGRKEANLSNDIRIKWKRIISTIPLPDFINIIEDCPQIIKYHASNLRYTSLISINLGIKGKVETDGHWIYFPEHEVPFHRVIIQSNLSPNVSPDSTYSLIIEKSVPPIQNINIQAVYQQIINYLLKIPLLKEKGDIIVSKMSIIKYAYPVYDVHHYSKREMILSFLEKHKIYSVGRFGSWEYMSMEDCFIQAKKVVFKVIHEKCLPEYDDELREY